MADGKTGLWLVGARGSVATTVAVGLEALRRGDSGTTGLVTESPPLAGCDLPPPGFVVGGHEVRGGTLRDSAQALEAQRVLPLGAGERYAAWLDAIDQRVRPGVLLSDHGVVAEMADEDHTFACASPREAVRRVETDLVAFRDENALERVVVVLLGSTEPPADPGSLPAGWDELDARLDEPGSGALPPSSIYAIGALQAGAAVVNFTPSLGAGCPAIDELARRRGLPHAGADGKTGETLLKSVLAPMFAHRNFLVESWVGHNLLGNRDGAVLADPDHKRSKVESKQGLLAELLGHEPQSHVSIEAIESLGDWKTAWDHVHFRGFLDVPMTLQFTWQGCDSALAAPLVIDLARLMDLALRRGESGVVGPLAAFFKSPLGDSPHALDEQMRRLVAWARGGAG